MNGSNITGPLTTQFYSRISISVITVMLRKSVGIGRLGYPLLTTWRPIIVSGIGTNFIILILLGYHNGSEDGGSDIPTISTGINLDAFGSINYGNGGKFAINNSGRKILSSCPACHKSWDEYPQDDPNNDLAINLWFWMQMEPLDISKRRIP